MPTTAAIATAASAVGGTAYNIASSRKAEKSQKKAQQGLYDMAAANPEGIFGSIPEFNFEEYTPMEESDPGYAGIVGRVLQGNLANLPYATNLSSGINKAISASTRQRIKGWDPTFMGAMNTLQRTRNQTLKGQMPYSDALDITADTTRLANDLGYAGGGGPQVAKNLGMKKLDLMTNVGPGLTASIVDILNGVDPIARHSTPRDYLIQPREAVPWAIADNQFGAKYNMTGQLTEAYLGAMPDPAAQGMFNIAAFQAGFNGGGQSQVGNQLMSGMAMLNSINWGNVFKSKDMNTNYTGQYPHQYYMGDNGYVNRIPKANPV